MNHVEYLDIGRIIKERRKELNITQEELCDGICEPVTISRIENGKQLPSTNHLKAILERLDLPSEMLISLVPSNTFFNQSKFQNILADYESFFQISNNESNISLEDLKNEVETITCENAQTEQLKFILLTTLSISNNSIHTETAIPETIHYIKLSIPNFSELDFSKYILDYNEFSLILLLSILHYFNKDFDISKNIINQLITQIDSHLSFENNSDLILKFTLVFMFINIKAHNLSDAYTLGIYIKEQSIKYQKFKYLGNLYEHLYYCCEDTKEKEDYLKKAYYMYLSTENQSGIQRIKLINKDLNF